LPPSDAPLSFIISAHMAARSAGVSDTSRPRSRSREQQHDRQAHHDTTPGSGCAGSSSGGCPLRVFLTPIP
jgi:hypothetical protein